MTPELWYRDAAAASAWLRRVFGLRERSRQVDQRGLLRSAELQLGAGIITVAAAPLGHRTPAERGQIFGRVLFFVHDLDEHFARACRAGVQVLFPPEDKPWGLRRYEAFDVEGHAWQFNQHVRDVAPAAWGAIA
jgi:uncharacterized glyoxalase superfamily protein PhnB